MEDWEALKARLRADADVLDQQALVADTHEEMLSVRRFAADIRAALERVEDYDAIRKERDYYAIEFSALTSNVPPGAKKTLLDTIRSLRQRVEELERAPRCCADTIPPGCRTCRCADAAEAKLAKVVTLLTNVEWSDNPWNAIKAARAAAQPKEETR